MNPNPTVRFPDLNAVYQGLVAVGMLPPAPVARPPLTINSTESWNALFAANAAARKEVNDRLRSRRVRYTN